MSDRVRVGRVDEIPQGDRKIISYDGLDIGVINYEGNYYALSNVCPHQGGPVCEGVVQGELVAEHPGTGERVIERFDPDKPAIACPWHGWEYDLKTGEHLADPDVSLPSYHVEVEDEVIYIHI